MVKRYIRTLVPHGLRAAAISAGLVSALALVVPNLATAVEISAITPALVAGFNAESVQDFVLKQPYEGELKFGLSAEDRQRIGGEPEYALALRLRELRKEVLEDDGDVVAPVAQRR